MRTEHSPNSTLLLILGAKDFPRSDLSSSEAFFNAAASISTYFLSDAGFQMPLENFFTFFDSSYDPSTLDDQITTSIQRRMLQLKAAGTPAEDLVVYYVGHGSFDEHHKYYLALKSTRKENQSISSLRVNSMMITLNNIGRDLRKYIIIDACFAAEAAAYTQSRIDEAVGRQLRLLPQRGVAFLCSSSKHVASKYHDDESNTFFTEALTEVLWDGSANYPPMLSLENIKTLVERRLANANGRFIRPEIYAPVQPEGDVAREIALFPNGPRRAARAAIEDELSARAKSRRDYLRDQAAQQAQHAKKLEFERTVRDEVVRHDLLAAQEIERIRQQPTVQLYNSEEEKAFREEAEQKQVGELNQELLATWLDWKSRESIIDAGALRQIATDHREKAADQNQKSYILRENILVQEKTGAPKYNSCA